jgi:hypothetical protein
MENSLGINEFLLVGILVLVGLSVILQFASLIKIAQMQNGQRHKTQNNPQSSVNNANMKKHGNQNQNPNKNKKQQDNRANQNSRPAQQQSQQQSANQNKPQPQAAVPEKKFEKIVSNALPLRETNAQLASRPKPQPQNNKAKVYSERPNNGNNASSQPKQERPANVAIKQQELPKTEIAREKADTETAQTPKAKVEVVAETKNEDAASVQYGRR